MPICLFTKTDDNITRIVLKIKTASYSDLLVFRTSYVIQCKYIKTVQKNCWKQMSALNPNQQNLDVNNSCKAVLSCAHLPAIPKGNSCNLLGPKYFFMYIDKGTIALLSKHISRFLEVFVQSNILFKNKMNTWSPMLFSCSRAFQQYQTWYASNYLNLINCWAGQKKV